MYAVSKCVGSVGEVSIFADSVAGELTQPRSHSVEVFAFVDITNTILSNIIYT